MNLKDGKSKVITKPDGQRLIVSYATQRAKKDAYNRQRGIAKLEKAVTSGKLTKKQLHNRGYNKYLKMDGEVTIAIDYSKLAKEKKWDGLKGYITNTEFSKEEIIENYKQLWMIEKTFRISKTDLRIRPVYHYVKRRIEAHICIAFIACKIYKELERQLAEKKSELSPEKAIDILKTMHALTFITPHSNTKYTRLLIKTEAQKILIDLFDLSWVSQ
jgi:transposase